MSEYLEFLKIAQQRFESQHNVLWKVETHYTWLVYIIAGALALIFLNKSGIDTDYVIIIIRYGSILGLLLAIIGYFVLRREGQYLWENRQIYARTLRELDEIRQLHPPPNWKIQEWNTLKQQANKSFCYLIGTAILSILWWCPLAIITDSKGRIFGKFSLNKKLIRIFLKYRFSKKIIKLLYKKCPLTVRDAFQVTLLLAALIFILTMIFVSKLVN